MLEHLDGDLFSTVATVVSQRDAVASIAEYIDRKGRGVALEEDAGEPAIPATSPEQRAQFVYRRLVSTGWLIEHRDRYRRLVDVDGNARLVLQLLIDIRQGRTRSYGGEVLQVLGMLEQARANPDERSEAIRNAARSARSFMHHLRSLSGSMRRVEQEIGQQTRIETLFQRFFEDFVAHHLIEDYKRLHTQSNPFRFRVRIVEQSEEMLGDMALLDRLGAGYAREGRASNVPTGSAIVSDELRQVVWVFDALDDHIDLIEETNRRVERRVRNTVRHMDRIMDADTEAIAAAMRALGAVTAAHVSAEAAPLLPRTVPLGPDHLFQNQRRRLPPERIPIRRNEPDPAFLAFQAALRDYRARITVNSSRMLRVYRDLTPILGRTAQAAALEQARRRRDELRAELADKTEISRLLRNAQMILGRLAEAGEPAEIEDSARAIVDAAARDFIERIEAQYGKVRRTWVMDRGIPTEEVLAEMRASETPIQYLVGIRPGHDG